MPAFFPFAGVGPIVESQRNSIVLAGFQTIQYT
jgi:hypothetical protein